MLPPGDPGRKVLVIHQSSAALTQLPEPVAADHRLKIQGVLDLSSLTDSVPASLDALSHGYPDYELREAAREAKEHQSVQPILSLKFRPVAGEFGMETQNYTSLSALDQDLSWKGQGGWVGLAFVKSNTCIVHSPFWLPREWDAALHRRKGPLFLNQGYPLTLQEQIELSLPPGAQVDVLPDVSSGQAPPLRWRVEWAKVNHDKLVARFQAELAKGELSLPETQSFQQQLRSLLSTLAADASFQFPEKRPPL
jgi:hypothetical protein